MEYDFVNHIIIRVIVSYSHTYSCEDDDYLTIIWPSSFIATFLAEVYDWLELPHSPLSGYGNRPGARE